MTDHVAVAVADGDAFAGADTDGVADVAADDVAVVDLVSVFSLRICANFA